MDFNSLLAVTDETDKNYEKGEYQTKIVKASTHDGGITSNKLCEGANIERKRQSEHKALTI